MSKHEVVIHENKGAMKEVAPYTGSCIAKETVMLAAFDTARNALELALRLDEAVHLALADVVPAIVTDESLTKLRVDNVMDLTTPKPYNLIHGQNRFRVAWFNMVLDDEGARAFLENKLGATFDLAIDEVASKQLFIAHTAQLLETGDHECHLGLYLKHGEATGINVWIDFTLRKE